MDMFLMGILISPQRLMHGFFVADPTQSGLLTKMGVRCKLVLNGYFKKLLFIGVYIRQIIYIKSYELHG